MTNGETSSGDKRQSLGHINGQELGLLAAPRQDALASAVVFLVALPLCMGIAIASGVPVAAGLITGIVGGIVVGLLAGCPLQVSGPAAGLTVIVYEIVQRFGLEMLGTVVLIAGLIQVVASVLKLGQWFRAVSPAVIKGMLSRHWRADFRQSISRDGGRQTERERHPEPDHNSSGDLERDGATGVQ